MGGQGEHCMGRSNQRGAGVPHLHHDHDVSAIRHLLQGLLHRHEAATDKHGKLQQPLQPRILTRLLHLVEGVLESQPRYLGRQKLSGEKEPSAQAQERSGVTTAERAAL